MPSLRRVATAACVLLASAASSSVALHTEELFVRPLARQTLAHFDFATHEPLDAAVLSPPALRQILTKYDAASLHLSFSVGLYDHARYGPSRNTMDAPFGARLAVAFRGDEATSGSFGDRWKGVTSELGGIFSASLNQMDDTTVATMAAGASAGEFGVALNGSDIPKSHIVTSSLAREELCTENLTPWLKMLPCRAHAGLGALVDPIRLASSEYAMLSIAASRDNVDGWRFVQRLTTVQPFVAGKNPKSLAAVLLDGHEATVEACPLASTSVIKTDGEELDLLTRKEPLRATDAWLPIQKDTTIQQDTVLVHRFQTGYGQVHGGLAVRVENRDPSQTMQVTYSDVSPWFLRLYFHTFQTRLMSLEGTTIDDSVTPTFAFVPAELRGRPNQFRIEVNLPPQTALVLSIEFDKVFVRLSEHPPDANRGFDIPSGVATFTPIASGAQTRVVYSEPLLVALPTPDFSMPYNVITLTSTVVAFFAGSMLNTLLRKAPRIQRMLAATPPKTL